jgi:hypothetical protein
VFGFTTRSNKILMLQKLVKLDKVFFVAHNLVSRW